MERVTTDGKLWIPVPSDCIVDSSGALMGAFVGIDEQIEWTFAYLPNGRRWVFGYTILSKRQEI